MKLVRNLFLFAGLTLSTLAHADIVLTQSGKPSGYMIKVVVTGSRVSYQLFDRDGYVKNLGGQSDYEINRVIAYSESLPTKINQDKYNRFAFGAVGGLIGLRVATGMTNIAVKIASAKEVRIAGKRYSVAALDVMRRATLLPTSTLTSMLGWLGGDLIHDCLFGSAERHELRTVMTSAMFIQNERAVLEVDSPLAAVAELDLALQEISATR